MENEELTPREQGDAFAALAVSPEAKLPRIQQPRVELDRVLRSSSFAKAPRLCALLTYVVEHSLAARVDELTEQQIGIHVFGRMAGFNSAEDTIVRGTARLLRQRLDLYYSSEGRFDPMRISIPKGSYIAHFEAVPASPSSLQQTVLLQPDLRERDTAAMPAVTAGHGRPTGWTATTKILLGGLLAANLVLLVLVLHAPKATPQAQLSGPQALWKVLFTSGRKTLLIPGDAGLDAFIAWEQRPVSLADYSTQAYVGETRVSRPPQQNDVPLATRSVTPMADLRLISELARVPEHMGRPDLEPWTEIRYARDFDVGDSRDNNLILIGSETFNPWITLYKNNMDFYAKWDFRTDLYSILNRAPKPGEPTHYDYVRSLHTPPSVAYAHLALLDNSQGSGKVLIIEGTSMGTTYAALTFLTQEQLWRPVLEAATDRNGHLHNFEVLLGGEFVRGGLTNTRLIALHVH